MKSFRNSHITATDITSVPLDSSVCSRVPSFFGEEIIVIDDDDEEEVENNRNEKEKGYCGQTSAVESLGKEMLELMATNNEEQESEMVGIYGLAVAKYGSGVLDQRSQCEKASKQPVPATPRTFLKNLDLQHDLLQPSPQHFGYDVLLQRHLAGFAVLECVDMIEN